MPFTLPRSEGAPYSWKPGRITVLSFCAFWCDTWKEQNRRLTASRNALSGLPVEMLTISVDGRWSERAAGRIPTPILRDPNRQLSANLGIQAVPFTLLLDAAGQVRFASQGIVRAEDLGERVRELLSGQEAHGDQPFYLTFDDFPSPQGDDDLLDLLRREGAKVTFFCIGRNVAAHPELAARAAREGHSLQLHSWDHDAGDPEIERCQQALGAAGAPPARLYRPPGHAEIRTLAGELLPGPTVNPYDFQRPGAAEIARRVLLAAKPDCVILLHAGVSQSREALSTILHTLRSRRLTPALLPRPGAPEED